MICSLDPTLSTHFYQVWFSRSRTKQIRMSSENKCIIVCPKIILYLTFFFDLEMTESTNAQTTCCLVKNRRICILVWTRENCVVKNVRDCAKLHLNSMLTLGLDQNAHRSTYTRAAAAGNQRHTQVHPFRVPRESFPAWWQVNYQSAEPPSLFPEILSLQLMTTFCKCVQP